MDFLPISKSKLKIKMNKREMKRYSVNAPEEEYDSLALRSALWRVLDLARSECGFSTSGEKLLVQIYSSEGGCEMFVTKLGRLSPAAERNIARAGGVTVLSSKKSLYKFSDVASLLSALRHVSRESRERCCDVYIAEDGTSHLLVEERMGAVPISELSILCEFGTEVPVTLLPHLSEHSRRILAKDILAIIDKSTVAG